MLNDHLNNTRVTFSDANQNGTIEADEVLQEAHYYPAPARLQRVANRQWHNSNRK